VFTGFMVNAWLVATIVAVVAGSVGFFIVLRGAAFAAHAIPNGSFAGAAGAAAIGASTLLGLAVFSLLGAVGISIVGRAGRRDVATALVLAFMLGLGSLFLILSAYAQDVYSLLFGEVLGVSSNELLATALLAAVCGGAVIALWRRLLLSSVLPEVGDARGVSSRTTELAFLLVVALATTMTVPVVGTLLIFSLMIGAPAAARSFTSRPNYALLLSVVFALVIVWAAIALSYETNDPIGFFVGSGGAVAYALGRAWTWQTRRGRPAGRPLVHS
jgi:zinc/manganese transport system permease protein